MEKQIFNVIERVLKLPTGTVKATDKIDDVPGWDSLAHVLIMGELEADLGIVISLDEAIGISTVAELLEKAGVK